MTSTLNPLKLFSAATALLGIVSGVANADPIYLNDQNIAVSLGSSMAAEPFANQTTAISLANVIDAPSADAAENHISPTTHVWVSGGPLELDFDFGVEYELTTLHFWNYHGEAFDVDNIDLTFFDASMSFVGELLNIEPALGGGGSNPVFAEDFALSLPSNVRFVNVLLTGTNGEVDFNNIGFTAIPEPGRDGDGIPDADDNCVDVPNPGQRDTNLDGYGNLCDADLNNDGAVDFLDLGLLKAVFFTDDADADLNGDGSVDFLDLGLMKSLFFQPPGPSGLACAGTVPCP